MAFEDDLTAATQALNDAAEAYHGKITEIDGRVDQAEGEYAALSANLKGVVNDRMAFSGIVDPDNANPTNEDGGTFNRLDTLINAAPNGSYIVASLHPDKTYVFDTDVVLQSKSVLIQPMTVGAADPIIQFAPYLTPTHNNVRGFAPRGVSSIFLMNMKIELPTAKLDAGLPWSSARSVMVPYTSANHDIGLRSCTVTGGEGCGLASCNGGSMANVKLYDTTLDGPIFAVAFAADGAALVSKSTVTLANGAAITDGGTLGTNLLQN
jgi:hypothetical protein